MVRLSTVAVSTLVPALKVLSTTFPDSTFLSVVRTNAPPLPGLTCWNSTTDQSSPSRLRTRPFFRSLVVAISCLDLHSADRHCESTGHQRMPSSSGVRAGPHQPRRRPAGAVPRLGGGRHDVRRQGCARRRGGAGRGTVGAARSAGRSVQRRG